MHIVKFVKMHGAGNDFVLIDDRDGKFPVHDHRRIAAMAMRPGGIGCEGVIILQKSLKCDFKMLFSILTAQRPNCAGTARAALLLLRVKLGLQRMIPCVLRLRQALCRPRQ